MTKCERCGTEIEAGLPAFLADGVVLCRECNDEARPTCPYCRADLPRRPKARSKCPACREWIYVWKGQKQWPSSLITKAQRDETDWADWMEGCGLNRTDYHKARDELRERWGREPDPADAVWAAFGAACSNTSDPARWAIIQEQMGAFLIVVSGKTEYGREIRYRARKLQCELQLRHYAAVGCIAVEILPLEMHCCPACEALSRQKKRWPLAEAIRDQPLPCENCTTDIYDEDSRFGPIPGEDNPDPDQFLDEYLRGKRHGNCRCIYVAVFPE